MDEPLHGAYGFRLRYPQWDGALADLVELDRTAPLVTIEWRKACPIATFDSADADSAAMAARAGSGFRVTRFPAAIVFDGAVEPSPDALIHPIATVPLAILARWRGDVTLHGGAFAAHGAAWVVMGERRAGKSTVLGVAARLGHPVVADDLVTIDGADVWAGPRCVDLREDAAARLGPVRELGVSGSRPRYRLAGAPAPARLPLGGFFLLDWHDSADIVVERLPAADRVRTLYALEYVALVGPADPRKILDLATLPAWRVRRPSDWTIAECVVEQMFAVTSGWQPTPSAAV